MTDFDMQSREMALRERELELEERKLERQGHATLIDWVRGLALPIASLVASVAIFLVQQQQQSFERTATSLREGYKTYFDRVSTIGFKDYDDFYAAKQALEITSKIYPEVYCGARDDLVTRIMGSAIPERVNLASEINELTPPNASSGLGRPEWIKLDFLEPRLPTCTATPKAGPTEAKTSEPGTTPATESAAPSDGPMAAGEQQAAQPQIAARSQSPVTAPVSTDVVTAANKTYRVFVQVGPNRDKGEIEAMRPDATALGFRMATGVETVRRAFRNAEVRYFGQDQAADAAKLADLMTAKFPGLKFQAKAIGKAFANLPQDTMEVWIPDVEGAGALAPRIARRSGEQAAPSVSPPQR